MFIIFNIKRFWAHKTASQAKTNQQNKNKQTKSSKGNTSLRARKLLRRGKLFIRRFYLFKILSSKNWNCPNNLIYYTTENMQFLILLLSNYFYLFISTHENLWLNCQDKWLLTHGIFKNAGSKPVRGRLPDCGTLTSKEALGT